MQLSNSGLLLCLLTYILASLLLDFLSVRLLSLCHVKRNLLRNE